MNFIKKLRQEANHLHESDYARDPTWRRAILEAIFKPEIKVPGKTPMSHLHPDIDKLHLPEHGFIADWRKYRVEDHPALVNFQKRCHSMGLHDPWLRNYAYTWYPNMMHRRSRFAIITHRLSYGFAIAAVIYGLEKTYDYFYPPQYDHTEEWLAKHKGKGHH